MSGNPRLGKNQIHILQVLALRQDPQTAAGMSDVVMTPETAAGTLRGLEKRGLVSRFRDEDKGHQVSTWTTLWIITADGRAALTELWAI